MNVNTEPQVDFAALWTPRPERPIPQPQAPPLAELSDYAQVWQPTPAASEPEPDFASLWREPPPSPVAGAEAARLSRAEGGGEGERKLKDTFIRWAKGFGREVVRAAAGGSLGTLLGTVFPEGRGVINTGFGIAFVMGRLKLISLAGGLSTSALNWIDKTLPKLPQNKDKATLAQKYKLFEKLISGPSRAIENVCSDPVFAIFGVIGTTYVSPSLREKIDTYLQPPQVILEKPPVETYSSSQGHPPPGGLRPAPVEAQTTTTTVTATGGEAPPVGVGPEPPVPVPPSPVEVAAHSLPQTIQVTAEASGNSLWAASANYTKPLADAMGLSPGARNVLTDAFKDVLEPLYPHLKAGQQISFSPEVIAQAKQHLLNSISELRHASEAALAAYPNPVTQSDIDKLSKLLVLLGG